MSEGCIFHLNKPWVIKLCLGKETGTWLQGLRCWRQGRAAAQIWRTECQWSTNTRRGQHNTRCASKWEWSPGNEEEQSYQKYSYDKSTSSDTEYQKSHVSYHNPVFCSLNQPSHILVLMTMFLSITFGIKTFLIFKNRERISR